MSEMGEIRLRSGDLAGAEDAFLQANDAGHDPNPGLSLLQLAQGDVQAAAATIRDALDSPSQNGDFEAPPNSDLQRASLLPAQVEIALAAGDVDTARAAADELERAATRGERCWSTGLPWRSSTAGREPGRPTGHRGLGSGGRGPAGTQTRRPDVHVHRHRPVHEPGRGLGR
jgi:hypothetical protein